MQFDMAHLWSSMGWVAKGVVFTLLIMSVWSIAIIFDRWKLYNAAKAQSRKYAADVARLLKAGKLKEAVDLSGSTGMKSSHLAKVSLAGLQEWQFQGATGETDKDAALEAAKRAMQRATAVNLADLKKGLSFLATTGATNFALFTEFASVGFLLVVIVALFCGDTVASEASWASLRYLLAIPVSRARLLRQKLVVALGLSFGANVLLPAWAYLVGGAFFGWAPGLSPLGGSFTTGASLQRLLIIVLYVSLQLLLVASLAFLLSVLTDAPLGAVGGATLLVVVSNILDSIDSLDPYRRFLPTHFQYSWLDALGQDVIWDDMMRGTGLVLVYSAVFFALAWWRFQKKDILS